MSVPASDNKLTFEPGDILFSKTKLHVQIGLNVKEKPQSLFI